MVLARLGMQLLQREREILHFISCIDDPDTREPNALTFLATYALRDSVCLDAW